MQTSRVYEREQKTVDALLEALAELPHARASIASVHRPIENSSYMLDAEVDLVIANKKVTLLIEVKRAVLLISTES